MRLAKALFVGVVLTCASLGMAQQVTVTLWDFLGGGDGIRMQQMIDEFHASQDRIRIDRTTLPWGTDFYTRVHTAVLAGEQADLATYHLSRFPLGVPTGDLRAFSDEELASVGLSTDDFFPDLVEQASSDGELYGVPLDIHALVLYYNKDLLEQAGLLGPDGTPEGIEGLENFTNAMRQVREATGEFGVVFQTEGPTPWRIWTTLVGQQGAQVIEGNEVVFGEAGQRALEAIVGWVEEGLAPADTEYQASVALFGSGRSAFHLNGVWEVPTFEDLAAAGDLPFEYGVMSVPVLFDQPAAWADSHSWVIPHSDRRSIAEENLQAALEFIAWMKEHSIMWATGGHIPASVEVVESPEYQAMEPNSDYANLAEHMVFDPDHPIAGVAGPIYDAVGNFLAPAVNGQLAVDQALQMFQQELESLLLN
jgi:multiple sugar transport system substrate-binding protein